MNNNSSFRLLSVSLLLAAILLSCKHKSNSSSEQKKYCLTDSLMKTISFDTVRSEQVIGELSFSGKITVNEEKQVKIFPLAGGHVSEVKVALGDYVEKEQVLAVIKSSEMASFMNEYNSAKLDVAIAKKNLDVTSDMYKGGLKSQPEYVIAQKEYQRKLSDLNRIKEVLRIYGSSANQNPNTESSGYIIKAPTSGFVVEKKINPGMEIRTDAGDYLFAIDDLKDVWAIANVYETDIAKIQTGDDADVISLSYPDKVFKGKIDKIFNVINPETTALNVRIKLQNPDYIMKPGMFARIVIHYPDNQKMLSVHSASVIFDENKNWVIRYKDKCNIELQQISIYKHLRGKTYIKESSLRENDVIITREAFYIYTDLKQR
jgi:cobalt-zinc-cadmium efflux system membrane fusion protein